MSNDRAITVAMRDGTVVMIEATPRGMQDIADTKKKYSFDEVNRTIEAVAKELQATIAKVSPKKATIKFGLEISAETTGLTARIVKGSGKANLEISLEWGS